MVREPASVRVREGVHICERAGMRAQSVCTAVVCVCVCVSARVCMAMCVCVVAWRLVFYCCRRLLVWLVVDSS